MEINYIAVIGATIVAMGVGALWYSPMLFAKKWMEVIGVTNADYEANKAEKNRMMMKLLALQLVLTFVQAYIIAHFIKAWSDASGVETALFIFVGFVVPTLAMNSMWGNESSKNAWMRFLIQAGGQLVIFVLFGLIFGMWG